MIHEKRKLEPCIFCGTIPRISEIYGTYSCYCGMTTTETSSESDQIDSKHKECPEPHNNIQTTSQQYSQSNTPKSKPGEQSTTNDAYSSP
jgi:ferredoxin-thioredoxin reductase catalytic subunit